MKIIIPLFTSLFLAAMSFAQEESASPAESTAPASEEKASATVETTPEAAASAEAAAPAQKKEEMAAPVKATAAKKETAAPAAPATAAKPATAATSASTAKPMMAGKKMTVTDMENAWEAAVAKHDYATLDAFVAPDFVGVSSKNKFIGRSDVTGEAKRDKDTYKSAKNEKLNVKNYGPTVTIVTGRAREVGTGKDGKAFDRTFLFTDTWMMRGGKWQCVASHVTKIKG